MTEEIIDFKGKLNQYNSSVPAPNHSTVPDKITLLTKLKKSRKIIHNLQRQISSVTINWEYNQQKARNLKLQLIQQTEENFLLKSKASKYNDFKVLQKNLKQSQDLNNLIFTLQQQPKSQNSLLFLKKKLKNRQVSYKKKLQLYKDELSKKQKQIQELKKLNTKQFVNKSKQQKFTENQEIPTGEMIIASRESLKTPQLPSVTIFQEVPSKSFSSIKSSVSSIKSTKFYKRKAKQLKKVKKFIPSCARKPFKTRDTLS